MHKEISKLIRVLTLTLILVGCSSGEKAAVPLGAESPRLLETKAQIKTPQETSTVKIQIALMPQKAFRLEISGTLGVSVATVLVNPRTIKIANHIDKTFISGPFNERTLYPVFKQTISARLLWKIVHDQNPANEKITCQADEGGRPVSCSGPEGLEIHWTYEDEIRKRVDLKLKDFEMNWIFKDRLQLPQYQNETFVLKRPEAYKEIIIK